MSQVKRRLGAMVAATVGLATLAGCGGGASFTPVSGDGFPALSSASSMSSPSGRNTLENQLQFRQDGISQTTVVVNLKDGSTSSFDLLSRQFNVRKALRPIRSAVLEVPAGTTPEQFAAQLRQDPRFASVELNQRVTLDRPVPNLHTPFEDLLDARTRVNDPLFKNQYALARVNALKAWQVQPGNPKVIIALADTGVDLNHPDLKDKLVPGTNTAEPGQSPMDDDGHGSHTAGIAAAATNNGVGIAGLGNKCMIMPVKVLSNGSGSLDTIAEGIIWAADHGAKVLSMSLGIYSRSDVVERALDYGLAKDVVMTASAGNRGSENDPVTAPHLPSTHPGVIEVAATDQNNQRASFSNFGKTVSVAAPGVDVLSSLPVSQNSYGEMSGTSMAAPHAAGLAGLIRSAHPDWKREQVKKWMESTANKLGNSGFNPYFGNGLIDAYKAISSR